MKIRADLLKISTNGMTKDGRLAEPEQQQVSRVLQTSAPIGGVGKAPIGAVPADIVIFGGTAQQMANAVSHNCSGCVYFDNPSFRKIIAEADHPLAPMENRKAVNDIRAGLLQTQNAKLGEMHSGQDGDMDVEQALSVCGFCTALTEHYKEPIGVHPLSSCPADVKSASQPYGFYKPINVQAARIAGSNYDKVMNAAQGKLVSK